MKLIIDSGNILTMETLIEEMKSIGSKVAEKVPKSTINNPTTN